MILLHYFVPLDQLAQNFTVQSEPMQMMEIHIGTEIQNDALVWEDLAPKPNANSFLKMFFIAIENWLVFFNFSFAFESGFEKLF